MDKICYTAIIGPYEDLKEPNVITPGWQYICYTDQPITSKVWEIVPVTIGEYGAIRTARYYKIMGHKILPVNHGTMWLDASFQINCNLDIIWKFFRSPLTAPRHPVRNCVYAEIRSCLANRRGDATEVIAQEAAYKAQGVEWFGDNIISSGLLMRDAGAIDFCEAWWIELQKYSTRDQIAFAKVAAGRPGKWFMFKWDYSQSKELAYKKHFHLRH